MELFFKQLLKWTFVIQIVVRFALRLNLVMIMGKQPGTQRRPIQNGNNTIHRDARPDFRPVKRLDQRFW